RLSPPGCCAAPAPRAATTPPCRRVRPAIPEVRWSLSYAPPARGAQTEGSVLTARAPGAGGPPEVVRSPPFDNLLVDGMSARGAKPTRLECHNRVSIGA